MLQPRDALLWGLLCLGRPGLAAPPSAGTSPISGEAHHRAAPAQLHQQQSHSRAHAGRKLTGRFLHITDFHPDPFYKTYSSTASTAACHRKRGPAGVYGAETSGCDSPVSLVNQTFDWIRDNIKNDIDFVIWTGDSARHDNDEKIPRTQKQIVQQNELIINKFIEVFARKPDDGRSGGPEEDLIVPIVPTFGNNDIMPHNIFLSGPNKWTMKYLDLWRNFIPEAQRHQFQQGGWFFVEVIPNKLAVFSLNTMYFFNSNSGVDGCANKHEPGYEHMEWLRIQLQIMRERGMKAILMGHVPPARVNSKESWDETCWQKYTLWQRQYRDVIVSSLYGHMNIDHFMLQDFKQLKKGTKKGLMSSSVAEANVESTEDLVPLLEDGEVTVASASDYLLDLRQVWAKLPIPSKSGKSKSQALDVNEEVSMWQWLISKLGKSKKPKDGKSGKKKYLDKIGGKFAERFSLTMVSPSVVPNYFPTLRIFEYNITGLEDVILQSTQNNPDFVDGPNGQVPMVDDLFTDDEDYLAEVKAIVEIKKKHKEKDSLKKQKKKKKYKFKVPEGPSKSSPPGPAYSPQSLTLLGYKQFFANLTEINNDFVEAHTTTTPNEDTPYRIFGLEVDENGKIENNKWKEGKHKHHQGKTPRPKPHPKEFKFEIEYDTRDDKHFPDLTVRHYVEHARRIAHGKNGGKTLVESELDGKALDDEYVYDVEQEETIEPFESQDTENYEDSDDDTDIDEEDIETNKKGKGKKKKKKHPKKHKNSKEWITFVRRAFVSTMDPHEIERVFGDQVGVVDAGEQDVIEL